MDAVNSLTNITKAAGFYIICFDATPTTINLLSDTAYEASLELISFSLPQNASKSNFMKHAQIFFVDNPLNVNTSNYGYIIL